MKTSPLLKTSSLAMAACALSTYSAEAVWITNFTSLTPGTGGSANGVWRDVTTANTGAGTDSGFVVNLTTTGEVKTTSDPTQPSNITEGFTWRNIMAGEMINGFTALFPVILPFDPGVNGDFPNIETAGAATSLVTFNFGARIRDPVLSFSDVDTQTTLQFSQPFTVLTQTGALTHVGNNIGSDGVSNTGTDAVIFQDESAGSIQFSGTFTQLSFSIVNAGPDAQNDDDRTGFVVTTDFAPELVPEPSSVLMIGLGGIAFLLRRRK